MKHRTGIITIVLSILVLVYVSHTSSQISVLRPESRQGQQTHSNTDTLSWRRLSEPTLISSFVNYGDSLAMWFDPPAPCSLIAIRFYPYDFEGGSLFHVWDGSKYDGHIITTDSTNRNGWIGYHENGEWISGPVLGHSPIGWNRDDKEHYLWGPVPYTITRAAHKRWIEIPTRWGLEGEINIGAKPFFISTTFFITDGWGFAAENMGITPFHFFKYYNYPNTSPDGEHSGWFLHSESIWIEAVVKYYEPKPAHMDFKSYTIDDGTEGQSSGNGNGVIEPEEIIELDIQIRNTGDSTASDVTVLLRSNDSDIIFINNRGRYGDIPSRESRYNFEPFVLYIPQDHPSNTQLQITLDINSITGQTWNTSFTVPVINFDSDILLVMGPGVGHPQTYTDLFAVGGISSTVWSTGETGPLPENVLMNHHTVIWSFGKYGLPFAPSDLEKEYLMDFLDQGGNLFMNGRGLFVDANDIFQRNYIHANYYGFSTTEKILYGVDDNPIVGTIEIDLTGGRFFGELEPIEPAFPVFTYDTTTASGNVATAVETEGFKLVFFSFSFEDIASPDDRWTVLEGILNWFKHETSIEQRTDIDGPFTFQLLHNYPNPFNSNTDIGYQITDHGSISLKIYNILGQEVRTLVNEEQTDGQYVVSWDGKDHRGVDVSSGIYLYRLSMGNIISQTRKMMLLR